MKKLKRILGIILVATLVCSSFVFAGTVQAATTNTKKVATDVKLQDNVQNGVILQAFCWSYSEIEKNIEAIAAAGYSAIQTSPVQQPKDVSSSTDIAGQWWKLYQPVSFSIADNSWLGNKNDLKSLCTAAHKYGVKIICDVVTNHLGASDDSYLQLAADVKKYEPTIWGSNGGTRNSNYFHQNFSTAGDGSVQSVVQGLVSACPDLNTGNSYVQGRVVSLLKECVDCGVDGFRFDAAKHIETPDDGQYSSSYWTTVLGEATNYAKSTQSKDLYYYGEILNTVGTGRNISSYTSRMSVTDNKTSDSVLYNVANHNASSAANSNYQISNNAAKTVLWAESHDTYEGTSGSAGFKSTQNVSDSDIMKAWAIVASRKDASAIYFARPGSMGMGGCSTNTSYKSVAVAEVNKFHNNFVGQNEKLGASGNIAYVARGTNGIVLVNTNGTTANASVSGTGLADGSYKDMITGAEFNVSGGTVSGPIGSTGIAVVTQGTTTPTVFADQESQTFEGETIAVKLSLSNATSGTYQLENYAPVTFTGSPTIRIGSDYNYGETITLKLTATDGTQTTTTTYKYVKKQAASSGVYVILPASLLSSQGWKTPVYCYVYDEDTEKKAKTYKNASWPGEAMKYDSSSNSYYIQVQDNSCLVQAANSEQTSPSTFNLAKSNNTRVIVSDSSSTNGSTSAGKQYPSSTSRATCDLKGTSHKFTAFSTSGWVTTTEVPGGSVNVPATDVTKGNETVATTASTAKPSESETAAPSTTENKPTVPVNKLKYGDVNLDGNIDINDVTVIQKYIASLTSLTGDALAVADVNGDNKIKITDATYVQKYLASMSDIANVGKDYISTNPTATTEPPTAQPTTQEITDSPTTGDTYTAYLKTTLAWIRSMGCELYLYDKDTGISYLMAQDETAYPNVFTAEVPASTSNVVFYRATAAVSDPTASDAEAYNLINATLSKTNNCYTLTAYPDGGQPSGSVGPYVEEKRPDFSLSRIYVDNSEAKWNEVYVYGWGSGLTNDTTHLMTRIEGTDIWYFDLPQTLYDGDEAFLFKNIPGATKDDWDKQSPNIKITKPYNCYKLSATSGSAGTWTTYNE